MKALRFKSDRFRPYLPDECQSNPNALGFELADWVSRELAAVGIVTSYPMQEDWGWFLEHEEQGVECMICCCGRLNTGSGDYEWEIYSHLHARWFFAPKPAPREVDMLEVIARCLDNVHIPSSVAPL